MAQKHQPQQREAMAQGLVRLPPESARRIGQTLGGDWAKEEVVQAHVPIFAAFLQELAGTVLQGIEGMADAVDLIQTKQDVPQYETVSEEADRVRQTYRQRGQVISRKEAAALVKSRRMEDPKYMDELIEKRAAQRAAEQADRGAAAAAAVSPGGPAREGRAGPTTARRRAAGPAPAARGARVARRLGGEGRAAPHQGEPGPTDSRAVRAPLSRREASGTRGRPDLRGGDE